jgi:succinyl-diaminopimelate desuccinylase
MGVYAHLDVERYGNVVVARTALGRARRVVLAGHLDTVPIADNVPSRREGDVLWGCGTADMKSGVAVMLRLAAALPRPAHDLTFVFYDCEEIEAARNGLGRLARERPDVLRGDFAIVLEPSDGTVEAGCQGTLRVEISVPGVRAHSARSWLGVNAIHGAGEVLRRLEAYQPRSVDIDGCVYREGLNAVRIAGGVAGNVLPDSCVITVNFRFAPDRTVDAAFEHVREVFAGYATELVDAAAGALPGLLAPAVADFVRAIGTTPVAKYGWTDVARFAELGIPALNFGPGDPNLAHKRDECVDVRQIAQCERVLLDYLSG